MDILGDSVNDIKESGDSVYIATNSGLIRITNKKFEAATKFHNEDMAYGKLKTLQSNALEPLLGSMPSSSHRLTEDQLRAAELEHERAERSFDKREVDAWKMLGWEVFRPSSAVQNRDTRELIPNQIEALAVSAGRVWMAMKYGSVRTPA